MKERFSMELYQLVYAATLAKYSNFTTAAEKLFITQPSLSLQIQNLEKELGFSIFYRNKRVVRLTRAGERLLNSANDVIQEFEKFKNDALRINQTLKQDIAFGVSTLSSVLFAGSIRRFVKTFPQTGFRLVEPPDIELVEMVRNRELNLAIAMVPENYPYRDDLTLIPLQECHICAVMMNNNTLSKRDNLTIKDLEHEELLFSSVGTWAKVMVLEAFRESGCRPASTMDIISVEARITLIKEGAISFSPNIQALWRSEPDIVLIPIKPLGNLTFAIIHPVDKEMSFVENSLIDIIIEDYSLIYQ